MNMYCSLYGLNGESRSSHLHSQPSMSLACSPLGQESDITSCPCVPYLSQSDSRVSAASLIILTALAASVCLQCTNTDIQHLQTPAETWFHSGLERPRFVDSNRQLLGQRLSLVLDWITLLMENDF